MLSNVFHRAHKILYNRSEERRRKYGPIHEGLEITAKIASAWTGKQFTADDAYAILVALKLSRDGFSSRDDNILDAIVYLVARHDYKTKKRIK
jgi:hypothetical protein